MDMYCVGESVKISMAIGMATPHVYNTVQRRQFFL